MFDKDEYFVFCDNEFSLKYNCAIKDSGITFSSLYQYILYYKALFLNEKLEDILKTDDYNTLNKIESSMVNTKEKEWRLVAKQLAYRGNYLKFMQNPTIHTKFLNSEGNYFIFADPDDYLWGIGIDKNDERIYDKSSWEGFNWLGETLTILKEDFNRGLK